METGHSEICGFSRGTGMSHVSSCEEILQFSFLQLHSQSLYWDRNVASETTISIKASKIKTLPMATQYC